MKFSEESLKFELQQIIRDCEISLRSNDDDFYEGLIKGEQELAEALLDKYFGP